MRSLLTILAIFLLAGALTFWIWVDRQQPTPAPGENERAAMMEALRTGKNRKAVPPDLQARALKLGADLAGGRQYVASYGVKVDNPNSATLWIAALSTPGRLYEAQQQRFAQYQAWRFSLALAAGGVSLLLLALAASRPGRKQAGPQSADTR